MRFGFDSWVDIERYLGIQFSTNDEYAEALIHTGIPAVEATISEYLEKYAQPQKITEALHSFLQTINDLGAEAKETGLLKDNSAKIEETKVAIARIKEAIENGHKGGAWVGICGELGADTTLTETFLRMGVDELSVSPGRTLSVRDAVRRVDLSK